MEKIKEILKKFKAISSKTKKRIIIGTALVIIFAVVVAVVLNSRPYAVLFSDVSQEEATEIIAKLQDSEVDYQYKSGDILVKEDVLDKTRAELVYAGYPTSGFTYNVFTDNAGLMTTDSDKRTYKLYELQNRIGATVELFKGVKDAKVTIALGEDNQYALSEDTAQEATASATVIMKDGGSPTEEQAIAIQRLVSRSIQGLTFQNVSVFDGNGIEVSTNSSDSTTESGTTGAELAALVENQISKNIMNILSPIYGPGNVRISAKGTINMEQLVRETIEYSTPEKIDENDKTGIIQNQSGSTDSTGTESTTGGVAGTDSNADVSTYNTGTTTGTGTNGAASNSFYKEYLVNQIKEQGTISPGMLEDLTISVAINGKDVGSINIADLKGLIGNAAGIAKENRDSKIVVVTAPFYQETQAATKTTTKSTLDLLKEYLIPIAVGSGILLLLIIGLIVTAIIGKKKRKNRMIGTPVMRESVIVQSKKEEYNEEIINLQNEKGIELRQNIRDFSEQNPEISAQLLKNWLSGGGQDEKH
ncbi:MAG: flagellar basal-body MS-ring/collar protein FliF [Lachnospiraceae bacterium]|nr:flagellar basal-body MS-ring/collar protein FliF [Lachnospiraceae bacterium]